MKTGRLIAQARARKEMTLADVAKEVDVSLQYVSRIEHGQTRGSPEILRAIGQFLGINQEVLHTCFLQDSVKAAEAEWSYTLDSAEISNADSDDSAMVSYGISTRSTELV